MLALTGVMSFCRKNWRLTGFLLLAGWVWGQESFAHGSLRVCASTPNLAALAAVVGGERVQVESLTLPSEDPHAIAVRPEFVQKLRRADLLIQNGFGLEEKWLPLALNPSPNRNLLPGMPGFLDTSSVVKKRLDSDQAIQLLFPDSHHVGNPHYLLDPMAGILAAEQIARKLSELDPPGKAFYGKSFQQFERTIAQALIGKTLSKRYDYRKIVQLVAHGEDALEDFLRKEGMAGEFQGWLRDLAPFRGVRLVSDYPAWDYFAARFGVVFVDSFEGRPGRKPSRFHLRRLAGRMEAEKIRLLVTVPFYDERYAKRLEERVTVIRAPLAHQVGAHPEATDFYALCDYNVRTLTKALMNERSGERQVNLPEPPSLAHPADPLEERLHRLKGLREKGVITEEEYQRRRQEILREI